MKLFLLLLLALLPPDGRAAEPFKEPYMCRHGQEKIDYLRADSAEDALKQAIDRQANRRRRPVDFTQVVCRSGVDDEHFMLAKEKEYDQRRAAEEAAKPPPARRCIDMPDAIRSMPRGPAIYAIWNRCATPVSALDQLYIAAATQAFIDRCKLDPKSLRDPVASFLTLSLLVASTGLSEAPVGSAGFLADAFRQQYASNLAFGEGFASLGQSECSLAAARRWMAGLDHFLTPPAPGDGNNFVDGCVAKHAGRWTAGKCECVANTMRIARPGIYEDYYRAETVREVARILPLGGAMIAKCGMTGEY